MYVTTASGFQVSNFCSSVSHLEDLLLLIVDSVLSFGSHKRIVPLVQSFQLKCVPRMRMVEEPVGNPFSATELSFIPRSKKEPGS